MNLSSNRVPHEFGFYAVLTNPVLGFEKLTEILVEEKVAFIQLRIKPINPSTHKLINSSTLQPINTIDIAKNLRSITNGSNSKLIINDDPNLAMEVQADGVHLGQDDMPYDFVRQLVGEKTIIGLSTHNIEQVKQANILNPDYIGMGPVYKTPTKVIADPALGVSYLKEMMSHNKLPFVVIGGIDLSNVKDVLSTGAKNICAVRLIDQCKTKEEVRERLNLLFSK
ncbi:MAG: thiamine phosphate synthase [Candidatus Riflemargulisbacteria bacterium]